MKLLVSVNPWYGSGSHINRMDRYKSNDPLTIERQLNCMQSVRINGMPIAGVLMTTQGPWEPFQHSATLEMSKQCGERGLLFALLLDPGGMQKWSKTPTPAATTANVMTMFRDPTVVAMLAASSYVPEKYVLDFNTGADLTALRAAFPNISWLAQGSGFSWISIPGVANSDSRNAAAVANLKWQNSNPAMKIPGICRCFNDAGMPTPKGVSLAKWTGTRDYTMSVWGDQPARVLDAQAGNFFFDQWNVTPQTCPYLQFITWNDHDEGTEIESTCSMLSGIPIY